MFNRLLSFGKMGARRIVGYLFWIGAAASSISSIMFGKYLYLTNTYDKGISFIQNGTTWYTSKPVNHLPLGIGGAVAAFIISIVIWKVACEVLYLIIKCMETYLSKNSEYVD